MALSLLGCTSLPAVRHVEQVDALPVQVELSQIAFYPQTLDQCGPAALATVLEHAGVMRTLPQLEADVYVPQRQGSFQLEMLGAVRRAGLVPYVLDGSSRALWREVSAGHPVVVLQNLRWNWWPVWHYAVVVGYDRTAGTVILRSGDEKRMIMPVEEFEQTWAKAEYWAFVALSPIELPATATEDAFVQAAIHLERVAPEHAMQAYHTAVQAWPEHLQARLALGNAYYKQQDLSAAQSQYEQALIAHPNASDGWNNLAQVLSDMQQWPGAKVAIDKAVALGGVHLERYKATQMAIDKRLQFP